MVLLSCFGRGGGIYAKLANGVARHNARVSPIHISLAARDSPAGLEPQAISLAPPATNIMRAVRKFDPLSTHRGFFRFFVAFKSLRYSVTSTVKISRGRSSIDTTSSRVP